MDSKVIVSPSLLSGDFSRLGLEAQRLLDNGAEWIHFDVMDGNFVPNITFGSKVVKDVRNAVVGGVFDVHLMISNPEKYAVEFCKAGADYLTFHIEATDNSMETYDIIEAVHKVGAKVGLSIKPNTKVSKLEPYLPFSDMILVMSVEPGFGGQTFMPQALDKIREIRALDKDILIEVDGGINESNVQSVIDAGANIIVAGSAVFGAKDIASAINALQGK